MEHPTIEQLEDMISDLEEQLRYCNEDTIADELITEIKFRKSELENLTQNKKVCEN